MASLADHSVPPSTAVTESQSVPLRAVAVHEQGQVTVVVHGELDLGSASALHREVHALLALPVEAIALDLAGLEFVDSSGIRLLNDLRVAADERRVPFSIGPVSAPVQRMLELTGMTGVLDPPTG
jgi:anti-anti-sigma factor